LDRTIVALFTDRRDAERVARSTTERGLATEVNFMESSSIEIQLSNRHWLKQVDHRDTLDTMGSVVLVVKADSRNAETLRKELIDGGAARAEIYA